MNRKYHIALVDPKNKYENTYMPTGLCYLSAYLKKYTENDIEIKIFNVDNESIKRVLDFEPQLIGFTSFTHTFDLVCKMAGQIKETNPSIKLVLGGQHVSMASWSMPESFDFGILGEGEDTFLKLIQYLIGGNNNNIDQLTGIQYRQNGHLRVLPKTPPIEPLDKIPFPDRESVENIESIITYDNFRKFQRTGLRSMQVTTSRGCPYKCKFCQPSYLWGKFRMHSAEYTAEEIEYIHTKYNINAILIEDDLFTGSKKRIGKLIDQLSRKNLIGKIVYYAGARALQIDKEWAELLNQLGVVMVELGIESGSDKIAKYLKRGIATTEINKRAINFLNDHNIGVHASFIAGSPPETMDDLKQTEKMIKWTRKNNSHNTCGICIATALPGTDLWDDALERGLIDKDNVDWNKLATLESIPTDKANMIYLNQHIPVKKLLRKVNMINWKMRLGSPQEFIMAIPRRSKKLLKRILRYR